MKIIFDPKLKTLASRLKMILGERGEGVLYIGTGMVNQALKNKKKYPKTWEIGKISDSFDYLRKIILNERTLENDEPHSRHRKSPEKIVAQNLEFDCGHAAVSTLLLMLQREDVLKTDVYERLGVNPVDGTKSIMIKKLFDEEDIPFLEVWEADLADVENVLKNGGVGLISYQAEGEPDEIERLECGHYSIIFDLDEEYIWLIDPSWEVEYTPGFGIGVIRRPRVEFEKLWIDKGVDGVIYNKWMMAVRVNPRDIG